MKLTNLRILNLQQCGLTNLDILKRQNFKHLKKLSIGMNNINNYSFLENLTNLCSLNICHNNLVAIDFITVFL